MPYPSTRNAFDLYKEGKTTREIRMLVQMVLLVRGFRNKMDEELRRIDQTASRMETLGAILNMEGNPSQSDVARRLQLEGATITRMVDILSKEGLVERLPDPGDRRVNLLSITPKGEEETRKIFAIYDMMRDHILEGISPEEIDEMQRLIDKMLKRLGEPVNRKMRIDDLPSRDRTRD
ncbi:MAG TPA: MarR family transcriptional regulator [Croceibacterium sp.]|nr:MarR family transcriptional regulator [Croceibacterium sp.]